MKVVKENSTIEEQDENLLEDENLGNVLVAVQDALYAFRKREYKKCYHLLDMASIGLSVSKIRIIKMDSENEKSN